MRCQCSSIFSSIARFGLNDVLGVLSIGKREEIKQKVCLRISIFNTETDGETRRDNEKRIFIDPSDAISRKKSLNYAENFLSKSFFYRRMFVIKTDLFFQLILNH